MCMEDVRIGREAGAGQIERAVTDAATPILSGNGNRFGLLIDNLGPDDCFLALNKVASTTAGIRIAAGDSPLHLHLVRDGQMVTAAFNAICAAGQSATLVIWESVLEKQ